LGGLRCTTSRDLGQAACYYDEGQGECHPSFLSHLGTPRYRDDRNAHNGEGLVAPTPHPSGALRARQLLL